MTTKLTEEERRAVAISALRAEKYGAISELAQRFGVSRSRVYQIRDAYSDPAKLAELEGEVDFRRKMVKLAKPAR